MKNGPEIELIEWKNANGAIFANMKLTKNILLMCILRSQIMIFSHFFQNLNFCFQKYLAIYTYSNWIM